MSDMIALDLVTPEEVVSSQEVEMVVVPGSEGDFGVLYGHTPTISSLRPGVIRVFSGNEVTQRLLVTSGFVEVTPERCTILATEAFDFADTSREAVEARHKAAKEAHDDAHDEGQKAVALKDVELAQRIVDAFIQEQDTKG